MIRKCLYAALAKLSVMFGGRRVIPIVYLLLAACLLASSLIVTAKEPERVTLAVLDECGGEYSGELVRAVSAAEGFRVTQVDTREKAEDLLLSGHAEALLTVEADYDERILDEGSTRLICLASAPGAASAELIRETVAGLLAASRSEARIAAELEEEGFDSSDMAAYMDEFAVPRMYSFEIVGGASAQRAVFGTSYACYEGIAALGVLLLLLTLSRRLADGSSRLASMRLAAAENGRAIAFVSDFAALLIAGLIACALAFAFAPQRSILLALGLLAYDICIAGLCLLVSRFGSLARLDIAAPFIALVTSVVGGCFADLGMLSPALGTLARFTPQGQLIAAAKGSAVFIAALVAEGAALAGLSLVKGLREN